MKYVRTKDDFIYKITTRDFGIFVIDEKGNLIGRIDVDEIIEQADTIEELCDLFVVIPLYDCDCGIKAGKHYLVRKEEIDGFKYSVKIKTSDLYGAIWIDKGLIYVAKMNEKGELELL